MFYPGLSYQLQSVIEKKVINKNNHYIENQNTELKICAHVCESENTIQHEVSTCRFVIILQAEYINYIQLKFC